MLGDKFLISSTPSSLQLAAIVAVISIIGYAVSHYRKDRPLPGFPIITLNGKSPKDTWLFLGNQAITEGIRQFGRPFQVMTGTGPKIILPNRYANEVRNNPDLSLDKAFAKDLFIDYPGFEGHRMGLSGSQIIQDTIKTRLTPSLGLVIDDLVEESTWTLKHVLGESKEWTTRPLRDDVEDIVARLTSRVFLGRELCRNERWLEISKSYTIDSVELSYELRTVFAPLQPLAYWFYPQAGRMRRAIRDAHALIDPEVERRKAAVEDALASGGKPPRVSDTLGWMYDVSRRNKLKDTDYVAGQLTFAFASVNNTVEVLTAVLLDVCEYPEVVDRLREEIILVIGGAGWTKTSLYDLKLMDSFLRAGARAHPFVSISMQRYVEKPMTLSDGTILPAGSRFMVAGDFMEPDCPKETFDAERFLRLREKPGEDGNWQFVTTSPEYMMFGHGRNACPGRFLASQEIKVALCHLIMKYDWRFLPGESRPPPLTLEATNGAPRGLTVQIKERKPEIDIDALTKQQL